MTQKEISKTTTYTKWVAIDGTEFTDRDECEKYEGTAKCVLHERYNKLIVRRVNENEICGIGNDENMVDVINIQTERDVDIVKQLLALEFSEDYVKNWCGKMRTGFALIGTGYEKDNFWFIGMAEDIIANINKLCINKE